MANNYTTSTPTTLELQGDNVQTGTIPLTYDIVITPSLNHVIKAVDFHIGDALGTTGQLPTEVTTVSFADTTTAGTIGNLVVATVTLAQWYTMGGLPATIEVDIDGKSSPTVLTRLSFTTSGNIVGRSKGQFTTATGVTLVTGVTSGEVVDNEYFVDIPANSQALVARYSINTTVENEGYYPSQPQYEIISSDPSRWSAEVSKISYATAHDTFQKEDNGQLVIWDINFYYDMGDSAVPLSEGNSIIMTTVAPTDFGLPFKSIDRVGFDGYNDQGILPSTEIDLSLSVRGSLDAAYDVLVMDDNGLSYDFTSNTFTRSLTKLSEQKIGTNPFPSANLNPTVGSPASRANNHKITVPAYNEKVALNKFITTTVTPTGDTSSNSIIKSSDPRIITLNQFGEVDSTIAVTPATDGVAATSPALLRFQNKTPLSYPTIFNPTDFPLLSTANNSYFNISTPLSYTVNGTVSSASTVNITLSATAASLKLQVGDSVTGTNVGTARTIVTIADPDANVIVLSAVDGTASGTLVFTRNVGISRQPLATDFLCSITNAYYSANYPSYIAVGQSGSSSIAHVNKSITVQVNSGNNSYSTYNNQTVQSPSIVGYPTVISGGGSPHLVLSSPQIWQDGETLTFSNAMSDWEILDISVSGAGTADCKLNVEGYVNRVGYANITESLILQNFITSYVAPVATAQAVDCPLGGSIKVFPVAVSHTSILTVATVGGRSLSTTISSDGSYLLYIAPATGATETISYTVNDGINTSAASANIVVTLT